MSPEFRRFIESTLDDDRSDIRGDEAFDEEQRRSESEALARMNHGALLPDYDRDDLSREQQGGSSLGTQIVYGFAFFMWAPLCLGILSVTGAGWFGLVVGLLCFWPMFKLSRFLWEVVGRKNRDRMRWMAERPWLIPLIVLGVLIAGAWILNGILLISGS